METVAKVEIQPTRARRWKWFWIGLSVRLLGVLLIWLGDGHDSLFRKSLVVVGIILSVGGISVLRYLLLAKPLSQVGKVLSKKNLNHPGP